MFLQHAKMDENVAIAVAGNKKTKPAGRVEPFDPAYALHIIRKRFRRRGRKSDYIFIRGRFGIQTLHSCPLPRTVLPGIMIIYKLIT